MKRFSCRLWQPRCLLYLLLGLIFVLLVNLPVFANPGKSDDELLQAAIAAYQSRKWLDAAMLYYAYIDRAPARLGSEPNRKANVEACFQFAKDQVTKAFEDVAGCRSALQQCKNDVDSCTLKYEGQMISSRYSFLTNSSMLAPAPMSLQERILPASYPLVCRGGGSAYFDYNPYSNFSPKPQLWINFEKAPYQVGLQREYLGDLQPGQCSWLDRGIAPEEPHRILLTEPVFQVDDFAISWTRSEVMGIISNYVSTMQDPNAFQSFNVYNDRQGNFVVTDVHYCTPGPDEVALFMNSDYTPPCVVQTEGDYANPDQIGLPNDSISSLRVGSNVRAYLCMDDGLTGLCETVATDDPNLSDNSIGNDQISSIRVEWAQ